MDDFDFSEAMPIPSFQLKAGARLIPCGRSMGNAATMGWKIRRGALGGKPGNARNARWRKRPMQRELHDALVERIGKDRAAAWKVQL